MRNASEKVFVDPNFIYYLIDRGEHFERVLSALAEKYALCTDVKALQEIVYRNQLAGDVGNGYRRAMELRKQCEVFPIGTPELDRLDALMENYPRHSPRELVHAAVMINRGVRKIICSPESAFHEVEELMAMSPVSEICSRY